MHTRNFSQISKSDVAAAGGKGASLGEMTQVGIPVPPGFVVLSSSFDQFLKDTDLNVEIDAILRRVNHKKMHTVENASEEIKALILEAKMPKGIAAEIKKQFASLGAKFVAVRSSATAEDSSAAAWAGQLESYLNTTEKDLLKNVQRCWASLFTPRAIFYRFEKGLHGTHISVAVAVQKMAQSEISGIAFSVHPVTRDYNQLIIEAGYGLGEAIVSGSITPDSYVVGKQKRNIIDKNIADQTRSLVKSKTGNAWLDINNGGKQKLTDKQILELSKLIIKIENHYGFPCDIEWSFEKNKFYIVQSRPITTLTEKSGAAKRRKFEKYYTRDNGILAFQVWDENQRKVWKKIMGWGAPSYLLNVTDGVAEVYYEPDAFPAMEERISRKFKQKGFVEKLIKGYGKQLDVLQKIWGSRAPLASKKQLMGFFDLCVEAWTGQAMTYFIPGMPKGMATKKEREGSLRLREKGGTFFEDTDRIMLLTMKRLFPKLGDLSRFITLEELKTNKIPSRLELKKRETHFIFFEGNIFTNASLEEFVSRNEFEIITEPAVYSDSIKGETAMGGKVRGQVKVILKKSLLNTIKEGDILVTAMTTPDFLPAMQKAAAFVTDEGGVTCHAAIVAREMKKPCIIGTKIASGILHDGDLVEVDANVGTIKILKMS